MKTPRFLLSTLLAAALLHTAHGEESYEQREQTAMKAVTAKRSEGKDAFYAELEKQARALLKDFPKQQNPYEMLAAVAQNSSPERAREILKEINVEQAPAEVRELAKQLTAKFDLLGKPVDLKFTATDGRAVDLTNLKGKVVLVDFWATWCGPCVAELPNVKAAYEKLHDKGFEIVGISFDQDKAKLEEFTKSKQMPWPQYFDGKGWENSFGKRFGISSIPAMWLIDKEGNLVDFEGRDGLVAKVEKLLAK